MNNKPIIIVAGEPNSIFSEIFFKALKKYKPKRPIILIISEKLLSKQLDAMNTKIKFNVINKKNFFKKKIRLKKINIFNINYIFKKPFEKISHKSKSYITECFDTAIKIMKKKKTAGLINGPVSKKTFLKGKYLGITEFLASKTQRKNKVAMLIYEKKLSVSPVTTHLPLKLVHKNLSKKKIIDNVKLIKKFYKEKLKISAKIAITGLNPHCESNFKSSEEKRIIIPAIKYLKKKNYNIVGPLSADTVFLKQNSKNFNVIVGMYHDQVLAPLKSISGFNAINITLGLPFTRVSPDHGPNENMIGKKISNPESLIEAIKFLDN